MSVIPLSDATRRPVRTPVVTIGIIVANFVVFFMELAGGDAFVIEWAITPAQITGSQDYITILTGMFMHGGWSNVLGYMIFLCAFGPEIEDTTVRGRYLIFYLLGG